MRLEPIERPRGLLLRIAYWMSRRQLGRVMTPLKVIYSRAPAVAWPTFVISRTLEKGLTLEPELRLLVITQGSLLNGCTFCADLHLAQAVQARLGLDKFKALSEFETSELFSERERAVLRYTQDVTLRRAVSDARFEELKKHLSEKQIVEVTWLNAIGTFFNLMAVPLAIESDDLLESALRHAPGGHASLGA